MPTSKAKGFESAAIHAGDGFAPATSHPAVAPIYQSSTFVVEDIATYGQDFAYSRVSNPNRQALGACVAALEGGGHGHAFSSGLAAEDTVLRVLCRPGAHVVVASDVYGGTFRLFDEVLQRWDVNYTAVDVFDPDAVAAAVQNNTAVIWTESVTNPTLRVPDIERLTAIAHEAGARLVVDNTFTSPYLLRPLDLGADVVVHSTTKYLGGHSDVVGGAAVVRDGELDEALTLHLKTMGGTAGAFDAWLTMRGIKTLPVRMERHCDNAEAVAAFLAGHEAVASVNYPGLPNHPDHEVAARQMRRFGGMVSFHLRGGVDAAVRFCEATELFALAVSLGGVESLVELPAKMTHKGAADSSCAAPEDLVRLSVGLETIDDLLEDLSDALDAVAG